ncbi:PTS lactose/cellobiose transporter subunit IIA [Virgibacillus halophilus]|uniref:PTS lactose/cellobiose transporter subunit IIA n=1 Tax=Tigheibacillus halophilus TaxID=361280 RepID=A0ABU5C438_9BACI|nr:PTS lactose/cellobiose transporter subunit IIA [Virgibacillus halophilus]
MEALNLARSNDFEMAKQKIVESGQELLKAHHFQTDLIQSEAKGKLEGKISILLIHAQDHLMNAMTVKEMAEEIIALRKDISK